MSTAASIDINSPAAAIAFSVVYAALLVLFLGKSFTHPTYVHYALTFFCTSKKKKLSTFPPWELNIVHCLSTSHRVHHTRRISRFGKCGYCKWNPFCCRILWAFRFSAHSVLGSVSRFSQKSPDHNLNFFFLLQSTLLSDIPTADNSVLMISDWEFRMYTRLALTMVGVIIGVVAGSIGSSSENPNQIEDLRIASVAIFLYVTCIQALQTYFLAKLSVSGMLKNITTTYSSRLQNGVTLQVTVSTISDAKILMGSDTEIKSSFWSSFYCSFEKYFPFRR